MKAPAALTAAEAKLKADGNSSPTAEQIADQAGRTAMQNYGTGSDLQRGIQAATAALQGLAGGNIAGALAGASALELANLIGHGSGLSNEAAILAHAILGGAVEALQGNNVAAGAASDELAARAIAGMLYPGVTDLSTLTEAQKQTVSTLATISAGMAGGLAGDSSASVVVGAQGGKNATENNALSKKDKINIFDINPMLKIGIEDADGEPLKGGCGIAKYTINIRPQNKHIEGNNEYKTEAASSGSQRSILTVDPQSLLPQLGTGQQVGKVEVGLAGSRERIDFGKPIGNFVDRDTALSVPTTKGIVHNGKGGVHIVPARP